MNEFIEYLKNDKHKAPNTVVAYSRDIRAFDKFLKNRGVTTLLECEKNDAMAYVMELNSENKSNSTINRKISSLRSFYEYFEEKGDIDDNPFRDIKSAKLENREIDYLTEEEVTQLIELPDDSNKGIRDRALLEVMYGTGARVTEIVRLRFSDIDFRMNFVTLSDGAQERRIVPLGRYARAALIKYMGAPYAAIKAGEREDDDYVFINFRGGALTRQGIWKILKEYGEQMGIKDRMTPQILRDTFAVHILQNGGDLKTLQELMGFDDMAVGMAYLSVINVRVRDVYNRTHPRA